jgi:hypothetical protein
VRRKGYGLPHSGPALLRRQKARHEKRNESEMQAERGGRKQVKFWFAGCPVVGRSMRPLPTPSPHQHQNEPGFQLVVEVPSLRVNPGMDLP